MPTVVGVRLRFSKTLWYDPADLPLEEGDVVVVDTDRGEEFGTVVSAPCAVEASALPAALKPIARTASEDDLALLAELREKESEALPEFRRLVERHRLDMKPVDVQFLPSGEKVIFFFSAEERVDFRELVRELAATFHTRVDMRQVGVRDEARAVGGVGHCGQQLCCVRFGGDFQPVSIRMAKEQDLPLNPLKISGLCGRLMCCLRYEYDAYKDFKSRAPKRGAIVETPAGLAKVAELNTPRETVRMRFEDGNSVTIPLSGMECVKGGTCPCSVTSEALEAATGTVPVPVVAEVPASKPKRQRAAKPAETEPDGAAAAETPSRRRRRRKSGGGSDRSGTQAPPSPEAQAKAPKDEPGGEGAPKPRTRRRRRRRSSGSGGE